MVKTLFLSNRKSKDAGQEASDSEQSQCVRSLTEMANEEVDRWPKSTVVDLRDQDKRTGSFDSDRAFRMLTS